jgi:hypothetical protein
VLAPHNGRFDLMSRTRYILAVVAVTTALCADQVVSAAPLPRTPVAEMAARLVDRLSQAFRRTVPSAVRVTVRHQPAVADLQLRPQRPERANIAHRSFSPFQFRLPPPAV